MRHGQGMPQHNIMSMISISREHGLKLEEAMERLHGFERKIQDRFGVAMQWNGNQATFDGKGVSGEVRVDDTQVHIDLKLGLLMRPLSKQIREVMERQIDKALS